MEVLRIREAARVTGLSVAKLRYLDRLGLVAPRFTGTHRRYGPAEMERLITIKGLLDRGYRPHELVASMRLSNEPIEQRPMTGKQVLTRLILEAATAREPVDLPAHDERTYNTHYKAVGRIGRDLGLRITRHKDGDVLRVTARPA